MHHTINAALHHQRCITPSTLKIPSSFPCSPVNRECSWKKTQIEKKCILNAALQQQLSSTLSTGYQTVNVVLKKYSNALLNSIHGMRNYIIKFCPTKNSIFSGGPRHEFETLRLKPCRKSEAAIHKCSPKHFFEKLRRIYTFQENFTKFPRTELRWSSFWVILWPL